MAKQYNVGDTVKSTKQAVKRLPYGSVIVNRYGYPLIVRDQAVMTIDGDVYDGGTVCNNGPYLIVHVAPEDL